jgi:xylulokinase
LSGGGAKSALWRQILADIFDAELVTVNTTEGAAFGAALLAGVGAGVWSNVDDACAQTVFVSESIVPNPQAVETYRAMYRQYENLYPILKHTFHALGAA